MSRTRKAARLLGLLSLGLVLFADAALPEIFLEVVPAPPEPAGLRDRSVVRVRPVRINEKPRVAVLLGMSLFPDVTLRVRWTNAETNQEGSTVWHGTVEGSGGRQALLVMGLGGVQGNVDGPGGRVFQLRSYRTAASGTAIWVREIEQKRFRD